MRRYELPSLFAALLAGSLGLCSAEPLGGYLPELQGTPVREGGSWNVAQAQESGRAMRPPRQLRGTVTLGGEALAVHIVYGTFPSEEKIQVGNRAFKLLSHGQTGFEGKLRVTMVENGREHVVADMNIEILTDAETRRAIQVGEGRKVAEAWEVDNVDEVNCSPADNAFILIGDNLDGKAMGNCAELK